VHNATACVYDTHGLLARVRCSPSCGEGKREQPYCPPPFLTLPPQLFSCACSSVPTGLNPATVIGRHVTIGAGSMLRSAVVEDEVAIGERCILMEGAIVESGAILADGTVVPPGRRIPGKQLWAGSPARYVRDCTYDELHDIAALARSVGGVAVVHAEQLLPHQDFNALKDAEAIRKVMREAGAA